MGDQGHAPSRPELGGFPVQQIEGHARAGVHAVAQVARAQAGGPAVPRGDRQGLPAGGRVRRRIRQVGDPLDDDDIRAGQHGGALVPPGGDQMGRQHHEHAGDRARPTLPGAQGTQPGDRRRVVRRAEGGQDGQRLRRLPGAEVGLQQEVAAAAELLDAGLHQVRLRLEEGAGQRRQRHEARGVGGVMRGLKHAAHPGAEALAVDREEVSDVHLAGVGRAGGRAAGRQIHLHRGGTERAQAQAHARLLHAEHAGELAVLIVVLLELDRLLLVEALDQRRGQAGRGVVGQERQVVEHAGRREEGAMLGAGRHDGAVRLVEQRVQGQAEAGVAGDLPGGAGGRAAAEEQGIDRGAGGRVEGAQGPGGVVGEDPGAVQGADGELGQAVLGRGRQAEARRDRAGRGQGRQAGRVRGPGGELLGRGLRAEGQRGRAAAGEQHDLLVGRVVAAREAIDGQVRVVRGQVKRAGGEHVAGDDVDQEARTGVRAGVKRSRKACSRRP